MTTITFSDKTITTSDASCTTVKPAIAGASGLSGYVGYSCSSDPVVTGSTVTLLNYYGSPPYVSYTLQSVSTTSTSGNTSSATDTFDYGYASSVWSVAFTSVVGLYLLSKNAGLILALIRGR